MKNVTLMLMLVLLVSGSLFAQRPALRPPDMLGLESGSADSQNLTKVGVAAAMEASQLPQFLGGILGYFYGGGNYFNGCELCSELQLMVGDLMHQMHYATIIPKTGFAGQQRELVRAEFSPDQPVGMYQEGPQTSLSGVPKYVVVPTISMVSNGSGQRQVDLRPLANIASRVVNNSTANAAIYAAGNSGTVRANQVVKATFALRYYDREGVQIRVDESCPQTFRVQEYQALNAALVYQSQSSTTYTLKPLADKLMAGLREKINDPTMECGK